MISRFPIFLLFIALILLTNCTENKFRHDVKAGKLPWKHTSFDNQEDKFTFAVFSDLTGGEREGVFEQAVVQLNLLRPELIVNVGDLIDGDSNDPKEWHRQWDSFDERAARAKAPIFYMGGNHDLTGELSREIWKERNGPRYYHFRYKDVLFLVFDTEDNTREQMAEIQRIRAEAVEVYKTEGPEAFAKTAYATLPERTAGTVGEKQRDYFLKAIEENNDVRWTFVLIHKPAWEKKNEQNFAAIESALSGKSYTVFYGHTHVYKYEQRHGMDYINLATTGGEQFPAKGPSYDHLMMVTVDNNGVTLANLRMDGILNKMGEIPGPENN